MNMPHGQNIKDEPLSCFGLVAVLSQEGNQLHFEHLLCVSTKNQQHSRDDQSEKHRHYYYFDGAHGTLQPLVGASKCATVLLPVISQSETSLNLDQSRLANNKLLSREYCCHIEIAIPSAQTNLGEHRPHHPHCRESTDIPSSTSLSPCRAGNHLKSSK